MMRGKMAVKSVIGVVNLLRHHNCGCFAAGYLLDQTDSWSVIFGVVAGVYALGYAGFAAWGSGELQHYDDEE